MHFNCLKEDINKALEVAVKGAATKPQTPQLAGVYLEIAGDTLHVETNNYLLGIKTSLPVDSQREGSAVVSAAKLATVIKAMPYETITFDLNDADKSLNVIAGKSSFSLNTIGSADSFPRVKVNDCNTILKMESALLVNLINRTAFACAKNTETVQPVYTGCLVETKDDTITFVATDKYRLMINKAPINDSGTNHRVIVPADSLKSIAPFINSAESAEIKTDGKFFFISSNKILFALRIIEGDFPDWSRVVPKDNDVSIKFATKDFLNALTRVMLISPNDNAVKISKNQYGDLSIFSKSKETGFAEEVIDAEFSDDFFGDTYNAKFLIDGVRAVGGDSCVLHVKKERFKPAFISNDICSGYVITPLRGA